MERKKPVVAYCRVSTLEQKQRGYGIDIQIRDLTLFAERQGLFVRRFYRDEAESGVAEDRKELKKLLRDCRARRIGTVIFPSLDRLSRDVRLAENLFHEFEKFGVQVLIADMPTYNGKDRKDVMIRQIREAIAEENRKDIIERLWKGRQERVRKGLPPGGNVPYGYRRNGAGLTRHEKEAVVVRRIFELAARGGTKSAIAKGLEADDLIRRNGKPWTRRQVSAVLHRKDLYQHGVIRYGEALASIPALIIAAPQFSGNAASPSAV
ncbi:MAG: recombinase family protein [Candidatus Rokubacteria bacterium]|nr:recombinase family protein [Candidatus Rokubacteria bacterium]